MLFLGHEHITKIMKRLRKMYLSNVNMCLVIKLRKKLALDFYFGKFAVITRKRCFYKCEMSDFVLETNFFSSLEAQ